MKAYKLTDENGRTKNGIQWGAGITHTAAGDSSNLCSDGFIHFYTDPVIAVLLNPIHANFSFPQMWEIEYEGKTIHTSLKSGAKTVTTIRQIPMPMVTKTQIIAFAILCAKEVFTDTFWTNWADKWLSGENRTATAANAAMTAATTAHAAYAAYAAANAAANAAYAVAYAYAAASAATDAAANVAVSAKTIDFVTVAKKALTY